MSFRSVLFAAAVLLTVVINDSRGELFQSGKIAYDREAGKCVGPTITIDGCFGCTESECISKCTSNVECRSLTYNRETRTCDLKNAVCVDLKVEVITYSKEVAEERIVEEFQQDMENPAGAVVTAPMEGHVMTTHFGTEFVLAFTKVAPMSNEKILRLQLTNPNRDQVTVEIKSSYDSPNQKLPLVRELEPYSSLDVMIDQSFEVDVAGYLNKGISVVVINGGKISVAAFTISHVGQNTLASSYTVLPNHLLANEYYTDCATAVGVGAVVSADTVCFATLIGTRDATRVNIKVSTSAISPVRINGLAYSAGQKVELTLDSLQVIHIRGKTNLMGLKVASDGPIAVTGGNIKILKRNGIISPHTASTCLQFHPTKFWGTRYLLLPDGSGSSTTSSIVRFHITAEKLPTMVKLTDKMGRSITANITSKSNLPREITWSASNVGTLVAENPVQVIKLITSRVGPSGKRSLQTSLRHVPSLNQMVHHTWFTIPTKPKNDEFQHQVILAGAIDRPEDVDITSSSGENIAKQLEWNKIETFDSSFTTKLMYTIIDTQLLRERNYYITSKAVGASPAFVGMVIGTAVNGSHRMRGGGFFYAHELATRKPLPQECTPSMQHVGDSVDNDCDGLIDEESCDSVDDDDDGSIDEDCFLRFQPRHWTGTPIATYSPGSVYPGYFVPSGDPYKPTEDFPNPYAKEGGAPVSVAVGSSSSPTDFDRTRSPEKTTRDPNSPLRVLAARSGSRVFAPIPGPGETDDREDRCEKLTDLRAEGTDFTLMFLNNIPDQPKDLPLELFLTSDSEKTETVVISSPGFPDDDTFRGRGGDVVTEQTIFLEPFKVAKVKVSRKLRLEGTTIEKKVLTIKSNAPLVLYGLNKETHSNDAFLALPNAVLSKTYRAVTYYPPTHWCQLGIAVLEDDTKISITFPIRSDETRVRINVGINGRNYTNGQTVDVVLNKYDAFQIVDRADLTGTLVSATKKVAVFSGNARTSISKDKKPAETRDHLVEMLPPTDTWGKNFITTPTPKRQTGDLFRIVSSEPNTVVQIPGINKKQTLLNAGDFWEVIIESDKYRYIEADKPVLLVQFVISQLGDASIDVADPSMILIPPIEQWDYTYRVSSAIKYAGHKANEEYITYAIIVAHKDHLNDILFNDEVFEPTGRWQPTDVGYARNKEYFGAYHRIGTGETFTVKHRTGRSPFLLIMYGAGDRESYGFPCGMRLHRLQCSPCNGSIGDQLDNDCDGRIDEEVCGDGLDDDNDGDIDEDCGTIVRVPPETTRVYPGTLGGRAGASTPVTSPRKPLPTLPPIPQPTGEEIPEAIGCYGAKLEMTCQMGRVLRIIDAHFGRISYVGENRCKQPNPLTIHALEEDCGFSDVYGTISAYCDNKAGCDLPVDSDLLSDCITQNSGRCPLCSQYLQVHYKCITPKDKCFTLAGPRMRPEYYSASTYRDTDAYSKSEFNEMVYGQCRGSCGRKKIPWDLDVCAPYHSRLAASNQHAWCPSECDMKGFLTIDLGAVFKLTGIFIQGRRKFEHWVTEFAMNYSTTGQNFVEVKEFGVNAQKRLERPGRIFKGNSDARTILYYPLNKLEARFVRIIVLTYNGYPAMHFDVMHCEEPVEFPISHKDSENININKPV